MRCLHSNSTLSPLHRSRKGGNRVAIFNWSTKTLRIIHTDQEIELPLSEGTIDQASFLFSFIGNVNVNQFEVSLTDGKRLKNYYYSLSDKTILSLPGGVYSTLLYSKEVEDIQDRQFEIWITPELFNIPVRVRYTDKKGRRFDSLITKIEINTNDPK